jgi:probable rRNA maturation factor
MKRPRPRGAARLHVVVTTALGRPVARGPAAGLASWLPAAAPATSGGQVTIAIVSDGTMRRLNRQHRGIDRATDVLSFPEAAGMAAGRLGDIAIAEGVARRQARDAGHSIGTEFRILALHGLLHLLGYDHETDRGQMARVEDRLRRQAGLPSGLIGRAAEPGRSRHA